jgi:hypothetical protein
MLKTITVAVALTLGSTAMASAYTIQEKYLFDLKSAPESQGWNGFNWGQLGSRGQDAFASVPRNAAPFAAPRVRATNPDSLFQLRRDEQWKTGG